jgi:quinol monooxygenase YgiN
VPKFALLSRIKTPEGKGDEFIAAFQPVFEHVEQEPGTLVYALHRSNDDPDLFWVSELYTDSEAFAAHRESTAMVAAMPTLGALIAESEFIVGAPISAKGVPT